ncbi:unnamed protein product [Trichobilharzia regenti]|nr:unnamed protein product [Trichobilharzia regenti]
MPKAEKAAGRNGIPSEALKMDPEIAVNLMTPLLEKVWKEGKVSADWKKGYLLKLPKKGDLSQELVHHYSPVHPKQNTNPHHPGENQTHYG